MLFFWLYYLSFLYYKITNYILAYLQAVESYLGHLNRMFMWVINCYHVASVVCKLFIFQTFLKSLCQFALSLTWMLITWYCTKIALLYILNIQPGWLIDTQDDRHHIKKKTLLENVNKRKCGWNIHWMVLNNKHVFVSTENPRWFSLANGEMNIKKNFLWLNVPVTNISCLFRALRKISSSWLRMFR